MRIHFFAALLLEASSLAGQTAPGKGICIRNYTFGGLGGRDTIVRFIRVRLGDLSGKTMDAAGFAGSDHCIIDHCSISWSIDEAFSSRGAKNRDTDGDGMPGAWEMRRGLDPDDATDGALDPDGDGYTNLEDYLNWLAAGSPAPAPPTAENSDESDRSTPNEASSARRELKRWRVAFLRFRRAVATRRRPK